MLGKYLRSKEVNQLIEELRAKGELDEVALERVKVNRVTKIYSNLLSYVLFEIVLWFCTDQEVFWWVTGMFTLVMLVCTAWEWMHFNHDFIVPLNAGEKAITKIWEVEKERGSAHVHLWWRYRFKFIDADGKEHKRNLYIPKGLIQGVPQAREDVEVYYMPSEPERVMLGLPLIKQKFLFRKRKNT